MANFNLVVDTGNFKPLSYNDMIAPLLKYDKDYDQMQERADKFIDMYGNLNLPEDSEVGKAYRSYLEQQNAAVDRFMGEGLVNGAAQDLSRVFMMNKTQVSRMKKAAEEYDEVQKNISRLGSDAIVGTQPTVDDLYNGKNKQLKYISASGVQEMTRKTFEGLNNALATDPELKTAFNGQFVQMTRRGGLSGAEAVSKILTDYAARHQEYQGLAKQVVDGMNSIYNSTQAETFTDESAKRRVWDNIGLGAMQAIQAPTYDFQADRNYITPELKLQQAQFQQQLAQQYRDNAIEELQYGIAYDPDTKQAYYTNPNNDPNNDPNNQENTNNDGNSNSNQQTAGQKLARIKGKWVTSDSGYKKAAPETITIYNDDLETMSEWSLDPNTGTYFNITDASKKLSYSDINKLKVERDNMKKKQVAETKAEKEEQARWARNKDGSLKNPKVLDGIATTFIPFEFRNEGDHLNATITEADDSGNPTFVSMKDTRSDYGESAWYGDNAKESLSHFFNEGKGKTYKEEDKEKILQEARNRAGNQNLTADDLEIYTDNDWWSRNHYRVVIKGIGERGKVKTGTTEASSKTPASKVVAGGSGNNNKGL